MQFNEENVKIRGDMEIVAKGTSSLMQREVQSQRLLSLVQVASNPIMAPFLNAEYAFKEIAKSMDLDPDKLVNDPQMAMLYARMHQQGEQNVQQGPSQEGGNTEGPGGGQSPVPASGGINPADPTGRGGGTISAGSVPMPNQAGFTG
jgi:hypothetical protein